MGPKYLGFQSNRPDLSVIKIKAISDTESCMTLSVQPPYVLVLYSVSLNTYVCC